MYRLALLRAHPRIPQMGGTVMVSNMLVLIYGGHNVE